MRLLINKKITFLLKKDLPKNPMHDDIYIVEFPKSGVTWLSNIIGNIELGLLDKENELVTFYNTHKYVVDVHQLRGANINRFLGRTFIKSHFEYNPFYNQVIYLVRNPFDVMISYYNFMRDHGYKKDFKEFVESNKFGIVKWVRHVDSWMHGKNDAQRIHVIKYEDLINDAESMITELYNNLGVDVPNQIIKNSLHKSSIDKMALSEEYYKKYNPNYSMNFIGKKNKLTKNEILTNDIKDIIYDKAKKQMNFFYNDSL